MLRAQICMSAATSVLSFGIVAKDMVDVSSSTIAEQRQNLAKNTKDKGFGPQAPRDISSPDGSNTVAFNRAPVLTRMNHCNIHFHKNAEHQGGEFAKYPGNGDGKGYSIGYVYSGTRSKVEMPPPSGGGGMPERARGPAIRRHR